MRAHLGPSVSLGALLPPQRKARAWMVQQLVILFHNRRLHTGQWSVSSLVHRAKFQQDND